ncbi:hypothetical protein HYZ41_02790, partial [archaeon]|nr:hypothetical protein [archaeon]
MDFVDVGTGTFSLTNGGALGQTYNTTGVTAGTFNLTNTSGDVDFYSGNNHITNLGTVNVGSNKFDIYNIGNLGQVGNGGITAGTLRLEANTSTGGSFTLTSSGNNVAALGPVKTAGSVTFSNGNHNLTTTDVISVNSSNSSVSIDVGTGTFTPGSSAITAKNLTITADGVNLDAMSASGVSTAITVQPSTAGTAIGLGTQNSGAGFNLNATSISKVKAIGGTTINIGASGGTGDITLAGAVNFANNNFTLEGGKMTGSGVISGDSVTLRNNGGDIGSSGNAVNVTTAALSVNSTNNASAYLADTRGFALGASNVGTGTLSISAGSTSAGITQSGAVTAGHLAVTNTAGTTVLNNTNNAISDLATFNATGRAVTIVNKNALTQSGALTASSLTYTNTTSNAGDTTLTNSGNNVGSLGAINTSAAGNFSFANGNNALSTTATINAGAHDVTLSSGTAALAPGKFAITANNLTMTSDAPDFTNLLGPVAGTLTYQQATASKTIAFNGTGSNINLSSTAITQLKSTGAASYVIGDASLNAGTVTIGAASDFTGKSLTLRGGSITDSGSKALTATTVNLQANGGNIGSNSDGIDVAATNVSATTTGSGSAYIKAASGVKINASDVKGTLSITAAGAVSQGGIISADTLAVTDTAAADVNLNTFSNTINKLGTISVDASKTFNIKADTVSLTQASGTSISVGTLALENTGATDLSATNNKITNLGAVTNTGGDFKLKNGNNNALTLSGALNVAGHDVSLETSGTGTLTTGSSAITAQNLTLSADKFNMTGLNVTVSGDVIVQPTSASTDIYVGGASVPNAFSLTSELSTLKTSNATSVVIGRTDGTGKVTIHGEVDLGTKPLTLRGGSFEDDSHSTTTVIKSSSLTFNANSVNGTIGGSGNDAIDISV